MRKVTVAFTPTCATEIGDMPYTFVELPDPPEAVRVRTCPPFESVDETTVTLALPITVSVEVVSPLNVVLDPPPEPHAPIVHSKYGDDEDTVRHLFTLPAVVVEIPVPPPKPGVTG